SHLPLRSVPIRQPRRFLLPVNDGGLVTPPEEFGHGVAVRRGDPVGTHRGVIRPCGPGPEREAFGFADLHPRAPWCLPSLYGMTARRTRRRATRIVAIGCAGE